MSHSDHPAFVTAFAGSGIRVAPVDINGDGLVTARSLDINDPVAVRAGMEEIVAELGPVDILINNAGILSDNKVMQPTPEEWNRVMGSTSTALST